jgi:hypothetical protein
MCCEAEDEYKHKLFLVNKTKEIVANEDNERTTKEVCFLW